jgi:prephenate dehydratase
MKIGYLGPSGTYTEKALYEFLNHSPEKEVPDDIHSEASIPTLFHKLEQNIYDHIVVPIENSTEGPVNETIDALLHGHATIIGEHHLMIYQALLAKEYMALPDVTSLYSHPQSIAQCQQFIQQYMPQADIVRTSSNAVAAEIIAKESLGKASIGDEGLAKKYGLTVLKTHIQDSDQNVTRFVLIGKTLCKPTGQDKSTVVFSAAKDQPGSLYNALGEFAKRSINLTSIASRPAKTHFGDYLFWIELDGHVLDSPIKEALLALEEKTSMIKVIGSYKKEALYA